MIEPGLDVGVADVLQLADADAELLLSLTADRGLGILIIEQPGGGFDQHLVRVIVDVVAETGIGG